MADPARQQVKVRWTETTTYEHVFMLDVADLDLDDLSAVHEAMDEQEAWDQPSTEDWCGKDIIAVNDREVDDAELVKAEAE